MVPNFQAANIRNRLKNRQRVKLAAYSNGTAGMSMAEILKATGFSRETCKQHIYALEEARLIERSALTGHAVRYGPPGTWDAHEQVRAKTAAQVSKYGRRSWVTDAEVEEWVSRPIVRRVIPANDAPRVVKTSPSSVWELAA